MRRSSAWFKNNLREIKNTLGRYIAILVIITLGVAFYSGLKVTKTAMIKTLDGYVDRFKMYDYKLVSSLGLTTEDVLFFNEQEDYIAEGSISMDVIADYEDDTGIVLKAHSITNSVNQLDIKHGRMPEAANECVLDNIYFSNDALGKKIIVSSENDENTKDSFKYDEYTVVGLANSTNYINNDRGTTSLGNGKVYAYAYLPEEGFSTDFYTEIFLKFNGYHEVYSDEYSNLISSYKETIDMALDNRGEIRYQNIVGEAQEELDSAQAEYNDGYNEYLSEKNNVQDELDDALVKLKDANRDIVESENKLIDSENKLADGEQEYQDSLEKYEESLSEYKAEKASALKLLNETQIEIDNNRKVVVSSMNRIEGSGVLEQYKQLSESIQMLEAALAQINDPTNPEYISTQERLNQSKVAIAEIEASGVIKQYDELELSLKLLDSKQKEIDEGRKDTLNKFALAETELEDAKSKLDIAKAEIQNSKQEIELGWDALEEGKAEYNKGLKEYEDGKKEAKNGFLEAEKELADAQKKINDAQIKIDDISKPIVFALDRSYNSGYYNIDNDSSIVDDIANVLPMFFFFVAALVCSTTMKRMVDEQRSQIGTLKSLGYSDGAITRKFMGYSGSAAIIGCAIGFFLGTKFFPMAIWEAYSMLYRFAPIEYVFDIKLATISLTVALLCSAGVTFISCKAELLQMPAQLIRPKAPKAGKRVFLEKIPKLWNKIGFLHKVSIRNIFRYKQRFFTTVIGVSGCTALIVAALGISNSISNIANDQFDSIMKYDYSISFVDDQNNDDKAKFIEQYNNDLSECVFVSSNDVEVIDGDKKTKATVIATDDSNITNLINLASNGETVQYPEYGKVAINEKLANELDIDTGDNITFISDTAKVIEIEVSGEFENYIGNYLYMTQKTYEDFFGEEAIYKTAYATTEGEDLYSISASLLKDSEIINVSVINDIRMSVDDMMQSLDTIIWLVILFAVTLSFVVIYNLNNINITERNREVATLKVLGFYPNETETYVFRESMIMTVIGAIIGLGIGKILHMFIMNEIKVEMVTFKSQIFAWSYIVAFIITVLCTVIVSLMLKKKIERINMTESLKSVE